MDKLNHSYVRTYGPNPRPTPPHPPAPKRRPLLVRPHNLTPGDHFRQEIDKAIHLQDKFLLLLSTHSVESSWVKYEVNRALNLEIQQDRQILYPLRLDDTILTSPKDWATDLRAHRHIGNFTNWQDPATYHQAFNRLLQDLKVKPHPTL